MPRKPTRSRATPTDPAGPPTSRPMSDVRTTETEVVISPQSMVANRPVLTLLTGLNAGQIFPIERTHTVIGRSREAWVYIDAAGISRRHARIVRDGTTFTIEDLQSTNGVFVNGLRVTVASLQTGDQVQIGSDVVLRFSVMDAKQEDLARQLYESSTRDALTGAYNRKYFTGRLDAEVAYAERHRARLGLLVFDLDHFKIINDTHGHVAGDAILRNVGLTIARLLRTEDVFARYGGEEFALLVRGVAPDNAQRLAERVRKTVADSRVSWESGVLSVTVSVGVASLDERARDGSKGLFALADERLYKAKANGRNCVVSS